MFAAGDGDGGPAGGGNNGSRGAPGSVEDVVVAVVRLGLEYLSLMYFDLGMSLEFGTGNFTDGSSLRAAAVKAPQIRAG